MPDATVASQASINQYDLAFQVSPIILQNGIAAQAQGKLIPIAQLTGGSTTTLDEAFARYLPLPGATLISNAIGMYPFANQTIAANAVIQQPLTMSIRMIAPVNQAGGYLTKLSTFSNLQGKLQEHNATGGTYIIATPAFVYNNLLMTAMTDITSEDGMQKQIEWQLDFIQPILTLEGAAAQQNNLMQILSGGGQFTKPPGWSGNSAALTATLTNITAALATFGGSL